MSDKLKSFYAQVAAIQNGDKEALEKAKLQAAQEGYNIVHSDNPIIVEEPVAPDTGQITQREGPLYKNRYDRWKTETAKGQETSRFVNGPLQFGVENILATAAGFGTLNRLRQAGTLMRTAEVAPKAVDALSTLGTAYFGIHGLNGLKQDVLWQRQFNPVSTGFDLMMSTPLFTAIKPTVNGVKNAYNSGNMWARALRGEQPAVHRVRRRFNSNVAHTDIANARQYYLDEFGKQYNQYNTAQTEIKELERALPMFDEKAAFAASGKPKFLTLNKYKDLVLTDAIPGNRGEVIDIAGTQGYAPDTRSVLFTDPLTGTTTKATQSGLSTRSGQTITLYDPYKTMLRATDMQLSKYPMAGTVSEPSATRSIFSASPEIQKSVRAYRDKINTILGEDGVVGGSTHSIAEGLHSGSPGDLEVYTTPDRLDAVLKKLNVTVSDKNAARIKGTSPMAVNGEIDLHVIDPMGGIDIEELHSLVNAEEHASKRLSDVAQRFTSGMSPKISLRPSIDPTDAESLLRRMREEPGFLTDFMRKNNLQGLGNARKNQIKFANRQTEMGLQQPLSDLDRAFDSIEAQIPGFVKFEQAYPNFDYTNVEGNKAFLKYFGLPEEYATDFERMKRLYRQQHIQFTPSVREFESATSMKDVQKMARKNAQFDSGDASGAGGNMLLSASTGGRGGMSINTAAQYLPTYNPQNIRNGSDYVNAIENTKLFERKITPEIDKQLSNLLGSDYNIDGGNLSDIMQKIARNDLRNPELNKDIQAISKIIDVPRMTGVRYGGTDAIYVGNLSGEPISETFSLGKNFEFGRSFNEALAPERSYGMTRPIHSLADVPLSKLTDKQVEAVNQALEKAKKFHADPTSMGFRWITDRPGAEKEIARLSTVKAPARHDYNEVARAFNGPSDMSHKRYWNADTAKSLGLILGGVSGAALLGRWLGKNIRNENIVSSLYYFPRNPEYSGSLGEIYRNSPYYFPYTGSPGLDVKSSINLWDQDRAARKQMVKENRDVLNEAYKKAKKETRKRIREERRNK